MRHIYSDQIFPEYDYTFTIEQLLYDRGTMLVKYLPVDTTLPAITLNVPIWPSMDLNNIKAYTDSFAPYASWYAQKMILEHSLELMATK